MNRSGPYFPLSSPSAHPLRRAALESLRLLTEEMAGRKLPGERELAQRLSISRQHLRLLLDTLESEGAVERRQGSGTYAVERRDREVSHVGLLIDARLKLGNDPFFSLMTERIQLCLQAADIHCVVERVDGTKRPRFLGDGMFALGAGGLQSLGRLRPDDPPAVSVAEEPGDLHGLERVSLLLTDDREAGIAAGRRLLASGCSRLLFFGRPDLPAARARWEGVQQAVRERFTAAENPDRKTTEEEIADAAQIYDCSMNYGAGRAAAIETAKRFRDVDTSGVGLVAANDWLAVGLRSGLAGADSALRHRPLVSFDGLPIADDPALAIHSLKFPLSLIAEDALAELRRLMRHRTGRVIRYAMQWNDNWPEVRDQEDAGEARSASPA